MDQARDRQRLAAGRRRIAGVDDADWRDTHRGAVADHGADADLLRRNILHHQPEEGILHRRPEMIRRHALAPHQRPIRRRDLAFGAHDRLAEHMLEGRIVGTGRLAGARLRASDPPEALGDRLIV
jgi:hypothetical protein